MFSYYWNKLKRSLTVLLHLPANPFPASHMTCMITEVNNLVHLIWGDPGKKDHHHQHLHCQITVFKPLKNWPTCMVVSLDNFRSCSLNVQGLNKEQERKTWVTVLWHEGPCSITTPEIRDCMPFSVNPASLPTLTLRCKLTARASTSRLPGHTEHLIF